MKALLVIKRSPVSSITAGKKTRQGVLISNKCADNSPPLSQKCPEKGDNQSLQETGTAVAPRQLPGSRGKEEGREEVHRHRSG